jgi:nucleoside 2-deoxyribosyltransferase
MYRTDVKHSEKDEQKYQRNEHIAKVLENSGIKVFLPQRDIDQNKSGKQILEEELETIKQCKALIIVLSDTRGIYIEAGYAKALGKKIVALKVEETREMSEWGYAFYDYVVSSTDELIRVLNELDS